jgi:ADP-heptose:LPS heptosyltransferase
MPAAKVTWAVQERCSAVIDTDLLVDRLHVFPREKWKSTRWKPSTWREQLIKYTGLRQERFDVGFDFQGHSKTALCLRLASPAKRFSSRATDALAARLNPPSKLQPTGLHEVELALALVRQAIDVKLPERTLMPVLAEESDRWRKAVVGAKPIVSIQTGAGELDKTYPSELFEEVAGGLVSNGCQVVAVGGPGDPKLRTPGILDAVGNQTLREALALVALSKVHVAADTGTGHAAAAYQVPVVSVFGRTDPARFRPWTRQGIVLREGAETKNVTPSQIVQSVELLLEGSTVARSY